MILQRKKAGRMIFDGFGADMLTCVIVVCKIKMGRCHISKILPNFSSSSPDFRDFRFRLCQNAYVIKNITTKGTRKYKF